MFYFKKYIFIDDCFHFRTNPANIPSIDNVIEYIRKLTSELEQMSTRNNFCYWLFLCNYSRTIYQHMLFN